MEIKRLSALHRRAIEGFQREWGSIVIDFIDLYQDEQVDNNAAPQALNVGEQQDTAPYHANTERLTAPEADRLFSEDEAAEPSSSAPPRNPNGVANDVAIAWSSASGCGELNQPGSPPANSANSENPGLQRLLTQGISAQPTSDTLPAIDVRQTERDELPIATPCGYLHPTLNQPTEKTDAC